MKTKYWIIILASLFLLLGILSLVLINSREGTFVEVWSEGTLLHRLDLSVDQTVTITTQRGSNIVTVQDGKAFVSTATCPDKTCIAQGHRSSGQIVCLPNRLVLKFTGTPTIDGLAG